MTLANTTAVPGFVQQPCPNGSGGPYTDFSHPRICWHTTETKSGTLAAVHQEQAQKQHTDVYHALVDPVTKERVQQLPLNVSASALAHPPICETNHLGTVQVAIVGFSHDMPNLSSSQLQWLGAQVLAPIVRCAPEIRYWNTPTFYGDNAGFVLASANSPQRFSPAAWTGFNGQCGHQHVPGNDHWDPGALNVKAISTAAARALNPAPPVTIPEGSQPMVLVGRRNWFGRYTGKTVTDGAPVYGYSARGHVFKQGLLALLPGHELFVRQVDADKVR